MDCEVHQSDSDDMLLPAFDAKLTYLQNANAQLVKYIYQQNSLHLQATEKSGFEAQNNSISLQKQLDYYLLKQQQLSYHLSVLKQEYQHLKELAAKKLIESQHIVDNSAEADSKQREMQYIAELKYRSNKLFRLANEKRTELCVLYDATAAAEDLLYREIGDIADKRQRCERLALLYAELQQVPSEQQDKETDSSAQYLEDTTLLLTGKIQGLILTDNALRTRIQYSEARVFELQNSIKKRTEYLYKCTDASYSASALITRLLYWNRQRFAAASKAPTTKLETFPDSCFAQEQLVAVRDAFYEAINCALSAAKMLYNAVSDAQNATGDACRDIVAFFERWNGVHKVYQESVRRTLTFLAEAAAITTGRDRYTYLRYSTQIYKTDLCCDIRGAERIMDIIKYKASSL